MFERGYPFFGAVTGKDACRVAENLPIRSVSRLRSRRWCDRRAPAPANIGMEPVEGDQARVCNDEQMGQVSMLLQMGATEDVIRSTSSRGKGQYPARIVRCEHNAWCIVEVGGKRHLKEGRLSDLPNYIKGR